jgi:hypothetical protein
VYRALAELFTEEEKVRLTSLVVAINRGGTDTSGQPLNLPS